MKIILGGAMGRMGAEMRKLVSQSNDMIVCGVDLVKNDPLDFPCYTSFSDIPCDLTADLLIDFSKPSALADLLPFAVSNHLPCVLCATGYSEQQLRTIEEASHSIAILRSANMSLGINMMLELCTLAAHALPDFDIEIVEKHHRLKQDAPSGTALMLYEKIASERTEAKQVLGRSGSNRMRQNGEIGISAIRGGTVIGEHEVGFYGEGEQVILTHRAENRGLFAKGALTAAAFLLQQPAGMYSMREVVRNKLTEVI